MTLSQELGLKNPIRYLPREALLNVYYTNSCLKKRADEFFRPFGLSDVQFNVMMLLKYQSGSAPGLSQARNDFKLCPSRHIGEVLAVFDLHSQQEHIPRCLRVKTES